MTTWTGIVDLETLTPDFTTDGTVITQVNPAKAGDGVTNTTLKLGQILTNKLRVLRMNNQILTSVNPNGTPCIDWADTLIIKTTGNACFDKQLSGTTPVMRWQRCSMSYPAGGTFLFMNNDNRVQTIFTDVEFTFASYGFAFFGRNAIWNNVVIRGNASGDSFVPNLPLEINNLKLVDHGSMKLEHGSGGMYSAQLTNSPGISSQSAFWYSGFIASYNSDQTDRCMHLLDSVLDPKLCMMTTNGAIGTWRTLRATYSLGSGAGVAGARLYTAYQSGTSWVDYRLSKTRNMGVTNKIYVPYGTADQDPASGAQTLRWLYIMKPGYRVRISGFTNAGNNIDTTVVGLLNSTTGKYYATADQMIVADTGTLVNEGSAGTTSVNITRLEPISTSSGTFTDTPIEIGFARALSSQGGNAYTSLYTLDNYQNGSQVGVAGQTFLRTTWETYIVSPYPYRREVQTWTIPQSAPTLGAVVSWNVLAVQDPFITNTNSTAVLAYTTLETPQKTYDYKEAWKRIDPNTLVGGVREGFFTISGNNLNFGAWNLIIDANAASVWSVNTATSTITIKATSFTGNITTTGTITFANGAAINGVYSSSAGQSTAIAVNLNQAGARLRLTDNTGTEKYNAVVSGTSITLYYPPGSTGIWNGSVELYGYGRQNFSLTVTGGGSFSASVVMIPDSSIVAPIATVSAYTSLDSSQKIRDWLAFYNQTSTGIATPQSSLLTSSSLNIGSLTLSKSGTLGLTGSVLTTGSATLSGVSVVTTGTQVVASLPTLTYPQQFTDATGTTNWLKVNLTAGQVAQDSYNNSYQTSSYTTFLPASYFLSTSVVITARGYKKQVLTVPYSTSLLATQSAILIPDASVSDTTTDYLSTATALTSEQQMYDAYGQYQATSTGILDTYLPTKSPGALDFGSVSAIFDPSVTATLIKTGNSITYKVGTVNSGAYYSTGSVDVSLATINNGVLIRASNLDSELVYVANSLTLYPTGADRDANTNAGILSSGGTIRFKYGSIVNGVTMSGNIYSRANLGVILFADSSLSKGANLLDLGTTGSLKQIQSSINTAIALVAAG